MMKKIHIPILICLPLFIACDYAHDFWVNNNSNRPIVISCEYDYKLYPDTFTIPTSTAEKVKPNDRGQLWTLLGRKSIYSILNTEIISIYIMSPDTLEKYGFERMQADYNILARYDITEDIDKHFRGNFEYPPSQQMMDSGMRIYINPDNPDL